MESEKFNFKKIDRKRFFSSLGTGIFGYFIFKSIPFSFMRKRITGKRVKIEINRRLLSVMMSIQIVSAIG